MILRCGDDDEKIGGVWDAEIFSQIDDGRMKMDYAHNPFCFLLLFWIGSACRYDLSNETWFYVPCAETDP